jgi:hypothetical protein
VRQSGNERARHGRISKAGAAEARHVLGEVAWKVRKGKAGIAGGKSKRLWDAERELSRQAEAAYRRLTTDWRASGPRKKTGAGATPGRASSRPSKRQAARQAR